MYAHICMGHPLLVRDWSHIELLPSHRDVGIADVLTLAGTSATGAVIAKLQRALGHGLLLLGDSTTRNLYVRLCAVLNGGSEEQQSAEFERLKHQAIEGNTHAGITRCPRLQTTSEQPFPLWYVSMYKGSDLRKVLPAVANASAMQGWETDGGALTNPRYVYWGLPVLHELWSPGDRERFAAACTERRVASDYDQMASGLASAAGVSGRTLMAGLGGSMCMCGSQEAGRCCGTKACTGECAVVDAYARNLSLIDCSGGDLSWVEQRRNRSSSPVETADWWERVTHGRVDAATPACAQPSMRSFTFDDAGVQHVNALMAAAVRRSRIPLLDMHTVSAGRCGSSVVGDGRHYSASLVQVQIAVLFEALLEHS